MKKMFKSLVIGLAVLGLVAGYSFAGSSTTAIGSGWAKDIEVDYSTSYYGHGNDHAGAESYGGGGFNVDAFAKDGWLGNFAAVQGRAIGVNNTDAYAWDVGFTSGANAKSSVYGSSFAAGETVSGWSRGDSVISGETYFQGSVEQWNNAAETGYTAGGISAGNDSFVSFSNGDSFYDNRPFFGVNFESGHTEGYAVTEGSTRVSIDPYGNNRSINGHTETSSYVDTNHRGDSSTTWMHSAGGVVGSISNQYGATAGGRATFAYEGNTDRVSGGANLNATINKTGYSTTVTVNASSYTSTIGHGHHGPQ